MICSETSEFELMDFHWLKLTSKLFYVILTAFCSCMATSFSNHLSEQLGEYLLPEKEVSFTIIIEGHV
jgi:hypothetical protein